MHIRKNIAAVAAGALIVVGFGATGAVAGQMIGSKDIKDDAVKSRHIKDGAVKAKDLSKSVQEQLAATGQDGEQGPQGPEGPKGEPGKDAEIVFENDALTAPTVVKAIGGSIKTRYTDLATEITVPAGTYQISVDGSFISGEALPEGTEVYTQLSLWIDKNANGEFDWSADASANEGSISPNALMPTAKDRHIQVAGTTVLTFDAETTIKLVAFGYDANQGTAGEGIIKVNAAELSALKVG